MKKIIGLILLTILVIGCKEEKKEDTKLVKVTLRQEWFPNANYAGELLAMYDFDTEEGLDLTIVAGSYDIDPIKMILTGENEFGVVSADRLIEANEKGADLRVIAVANYKSPTCFISKTSSKVNKPQDFIGKRVGILTGTNTEIIYNLLISKLSLDREKIEEIEVPFDLNTFLLGKYDIRPAFAYDEPVSLELQNIEYNIIRPEDYGINFIGTVYFCKAQLIKNRPELVKSFVNSLKKGWNKTFEKPQYSIELLKKFDSQIDEGRELKSLNKAIPYFKGENNKVLFASKETWNETANYLIQLGKVKSFKFEDNVDYTFLNE